ncbi:glycine-rich domain-containing protein [Acetobacterium wieringae]|uniref:glycine-rich domain-containing protein n=1 Tax=Acetobacterium wieringae TaxID=52694 RepID=UPI002B20CC77|nr:hypothetical protein [Acetobacterium wieringae]MEA4805071.1 hypothetical protein [Acetobacterium wieringae]
MATAILTGQGGKRYKTNQITGLTATVGWATANTVKLTWTNPTDVNFKGLVIRYKSGSYPTSPTDGYSFYDSNDATPVATYTVTGGNIVDGTTFYFRAFAYSYIGATRVYNSSTTGAQASGTPYRAQGTQIFTSSGTFTVPFGVNAVDVFLVGGGAGGGAEYSYTKGAGGSGGCTKTVKGLVVTPGANMAVVVGAGGIGSTTTTNTNKDGGPGGASSFGGYSANGGTMATGGSGGGGGGYEYASSYHGGVGGADGANGVTSATGAGTGQGTTTREFATAGATLYAGGGGGGGQCLTKGTDGRPSERGLGGAGGGGAGGYMNYSDALMKYLLRGTDGTANTGGGGGGSASYNATNASYGGGTGGSGIVIIRWGY